MFFWIELSKAGRSLRHAFSRRSILGWGFDCCCGWPGAGGARSGRSGSVDGPPARCATLRFPALPCAALRCAELRLYTHGYLWIHMDTYGYL